MLFRTALTGIAIAAGLGVLANLPSPEQVAHWAKSVLPPPELVAAGVRNALPTPQQVAGTAMQNAVAQNHATTQTPRYVFVEMGASSGQVAATVPSVPYVGSLRWINGE